MKRHAEMPAARMAISSLRRFRPTKAANTPNKKAKGSSIRMTLGDCRRVRPKSWAGEVSLTRTPTSRERATKSTRPMMAAMIAKAAPTATRVRIRT